MGISLYSIHIYSECEVSFEGFQFESFSENWYTFTKNLRAEDADHSNEMARQLSKITEYPVLLFGIFDSEMIFFTFFKNGKIISRYSDDEFVANKKLYDIPALTGYGEGQKRRLSTILACSDTELKVDMLEEYFGVCLLFDEELIQEGFSLKRTRGDEIYKKYMQEEKLLSGKKSPYSVNLIAEYPGKLFDHYFESSETLTKPHFYLYGYSNAKIDPMSYSKLTPVEFTGTSLEKADENIFIPKIYKGYDNPDFKMQYGAVDTIIFSESCPPGFAGKSMKSPRGYYPRGFLSSSELILEGSRRIMIVDDTFKVSAKLSIKGDIADIIENYILTTVGNSFFAYEYDPRAKICIYRIEKING